MDNPASACALELRHPVPQPQLAAGRRQGLLQLLAEYLH